jgi:broad specificity phosphatase PhoE
MAAIVLVRHASTAWSGVRYCGRSDPPLSPAGRAEAARLAADLARDLPPRTRIVSSPSRRAVATAMAIADVADLPGVEIDDRWREADVGIAEGRTFDELAAIAPALAARLAGGDMAVDWPDGETHASLAERVSAAWTDLVADGRPVVVVTHAGPLVHARALAEDRPHSSDDLVGPATAIRLETGTDRPSSSSVLPSRA